MKGCLKATLVFMLFLWGCSVVAQSDEYRLGPGDEIKIQVYEEAELSMSFRIGESGVFNYPYLGVVQATGRTIVELEQSVTKGLLEDVLVNPSVNVSMVTYRIYYIGGEVNKPGGYPYHPGITILQAMTIAGGPTEWASSSKFEILREGAEEPVQANKKTLVRPGDTVTILEGIF